MFSQLSFPEKPRRNWFRLGSLAVHGLLLAWLLHAPEPQLLNPVSVAFGENGKSLTRLYWPSKRHDESTHSSSDSATERYRHQRLSHQTLTWQASERARQALRRKDALTREQDVAKTQTLSAEGHGTQAGVLYGTLNQGPIYGDEIRPALPFETSDPVVFPWQLPSAAGNEVIEITIDERGDIINKKVLQSLGSDIDNKCLAALDNWHFHPATRNGAPIASKQDAIFPFRARG
ncbi:MAG TPA: energy transducer TonB [Verrucomicrobiae bacterium]|nr:energy transducer TonB [Verrucomicrobiae bacterium]